MKWRLRPRRVDERDALLQICASTFDQMTAHATELQTLLAHIATAMQAVEGGEAMSRKDAASLREAAQSLCIDLSEVIAGCQAGADACRSVGKLPDRNFATSSGAVLPFRGS